MADNLLNTETLTEEFKVENMVQIQVTRQEAEEIAHNRRDLCIIVGSNNVLEKRILETSVEILGILNAPKTPVTKKAPRSTRKTSK